MRGGVALWRKFEACVAVEVARTLTASGVRVRPFNQTWMLQTPFCVVNSL